LEGSQLRFPNTPQSSSTQPTLPGVQQQPQTQSPQKFYPEAKQPKPTPSIQPIKPASAQAQGIATPRGAGANKFQSTAVAGIILNSQPLLFEPLAKTKFFCRTIWWIPQHS